ncbi:MAG: YqgE/AlgH family protein [Chitinophagaceae bacterium]
MNTTQAHTGDFLIAEPFLKDNSFSRSVVLLCEADVNGALGFIINKSLPHRLCDLIVEMQGVEFPILYGGPVRMDLMHFLHSIPDKIFGGIAVGDGIYWGGNFDTMLHLIKTGEANTENLRLILGQSGWTENQLQSEIHENTWLSTKAKRRIVFGSDMENIWKESVRLMGKQYAEIINYPLDPSLN